MMTTAPCPARLLVLRVRSGAAGFERKGGGRSARNPSQPEAIPQRVETKRPWCRYAASNAGTNQNQRHSLVLTQSASCDSLVIASAARWEAGGGRGRRPARAQTPRESRRASARSLRTVGTLRVHRSPQRTSRAGRNMRRANLLIAPACPNLPEAFRSSSSAQAARVGPAEVASPTQLLSGTDLLSPRADNTNSSLDTALRPNSLHSKRP
jgi:hypothetical protein